MTEETKYARVSPDTLLASVLALTNLAVLLTLWDTVGVQADESLNIYGALRILDGERIYKDFWMYNPPGIFLWTATVFALLGKSLFSIRIMLVLASSFSVAVLFLLGRTFMGRGWSSVAPVLFIAAGVNLWPVAGYHWYSTFMLIWSVYCAARFLDERSRTWSLLASGFLAGVTFLFQQPKGGLLIAFMFMFLAIEALVWGWRRNSKDAAIGTGVLFAIGVAAPVLSAALYFICYGTLRDAISATVVFPFRLISEGGGQPGYALYYGAMTREIVGQILQASPLHLPGWIASAAASLVNFAGPMFIPLGILVWMGRRLVGTSHTSIPLLCACAAFAAFGSSLQKPDFHHLLTVGPMCYLMIAYVFSSLAGNGKGILRRAGSALPAAVLMGGAVGLLLSNLLFARSVVRVPLSSSLGFIAVSGRPVSEVVAERIPLVKVIDYVRVNTSPDETVFVMSYSPFIYYLSERRNPTPYADIPSSPCGEGAKFHVLKLGHASSNLERLEKTVRSLEADKTPLVVLDPASSCQVTGDVNEYGFDPLVEYLRTHYRIEVEYGPYVIMTRSD